MKYIHAILTSMLAGIVFLAGAGFALGHGSGTALDKQVGDYTVSVDYDAVAGIFAGDPVQFAFQLFNKGKAPPIDFADVWVTITPTGTDAKYAPPVFSSGIAMPHFAPAGMTFAFPQKGSYDLSVRFEKDEKILAEATFPLTATEYSKGFTLTKDTLIGAASGFAFSAVVWVVCTLFLKRKRL